MNVAHRWSLLVAAEAAMTVFLLMYGLTFTDSIPLHRIQLAILTSLGVIGWVVTVSRPRILPPLLVAAPLPLLLALAITSITSSYPSLTGFATWQSAAYVGIAWLLAIQARHPTGRRNLIAAMGIVVAIVIAVYLFQVAFAWADWLGFGFPISSLPLRPLYSGGLVLIPAWLADVVVLGAPIVVASLWASRARVLAAALGLSGSVAIVVSGTRSVLLLIVALSVVGGLLFVIRQGSRRAKLRVGYSVVAIAGLGAAVVARRDRDFDLGRSSSFASAIDNFAMSPLVGAGPGTYGVQRMNDPADTLANLAQPDAVNVFLTTASDSGVVGLVGLGLTVVAFGIAIRKSLKGDSDDRPIILAAILGVLVVAGHALGEVVFGLIGVVLMLIAAVSIASTTSSSPMPRTETRPNWLTAGLAAGLLVLVISTSVVLRNEATLDGVARADALLVESPVAAAAAARDATRASPDSAPAWWVRMVAADAAGNLMESLEAAREVVALEGFAQEWLLLGILQSKTGDSVGAREAIDRAASLGPPDAFVLLNVAMYYHSSGATDLAREASTELLIARPDIEPILRTGLPRLAHIVGSVRTRAATVSMNSGDVSKAMLIALSGEDRKLSDSLLQQIAVADPPSLDTWKTIVRAWFGDSSARATHDAVAITRPSGLLLAWSWFLAGRECDLIAAARWERAIAILAAYQPSTPTAIGSAPGFQVRSLPPRYPGVVWRMNHPERPYIEGIWTYALGRPACSASSGG